MSDDLFGFIQNAKSFEELASISSQVVSLERFKHLVLSGLKQHGQNSKARTKDEIVREMKQVFRRLNFDEAVSGTNQRRSKESLLRHKLKTTQHLIKTPNCFVPKIAKKIMMQYLSPEMSLNLIHCYKDNADLAQIKQMNEIICSINDECKNKQRVQSKSENESIVGNRKSNLFNVVSNESILNIVSYLCKKDVIHFKATSRRIAIICLEKMEKYQIISFNMNNLIDVNQSEYYSNYFDIEHDAISNRYNGNLSVGHLKQIWSKQYGIKEEDLLIYYAELILTYQDSSYDFEQRFEYLTSDPSPKYPGSGIGASFSNDVSSVFDLFLQSRSKCLLFDKSNMIKMDHNGKVSDVDITNDRITYDYMEQNKIFFLTLSYYDPSKLAISPIQHVMVEADKFDLTLIKKYIENGLVAKNEKQRLFKKMFKEQRESMKSDRFFLYAPDAHDIHSLYDTNFTIWRQTDPNDEWNIELSGMQCGYSVIIFSLVDIEIANYPKPGKLCVLSKVGEEDF